MKKFVRMPLLATALAAIVALALFAGSASAAAGVQTDAGITQFGPGPWGGPGRGPGPGTGSRSPLGGMWMRGRPGATQATLDLSTEEALDIAQAYLDDNQAGAVAEATRNPVWFGSYHFHILVDGEISGALAVDGTTGEVVELPGDCPWLDAD